MFGNCPVWMKVIATELEQKVENCVISLPSGTITALPTQWRKCMHSTAEGYSLILVMIESLLLKPSFSIQMISNVI